MKTRAELKCHRLNSQYVLTRDRRCQIPWCETPTQELSNHHLFPRAQGDWKIILEPDYCIALCITHHNFAEEHREEFWDKIIPMIRSKDEARADKILKWKNSLKPPQRERADYEEIAVNLTRRLKKLRDKVVLDADIEPEFRGRAVS